MYKCKFHPFNNNNNLSTTKKLILPPFNTKKTKFEIKYYYNDLTSVYLRCCYYPVNYSIFSPCFFWSSFVWIIATRKKIFIMFEVITFFCRECAKIGIKINLSDSPLCNISGPDIGVMWLQGRKKFICESEFSRSKSNHFKNE